MEAWEYGVLILAVLAGGGAAVLFGDRRQTLLPHALSFTGAYILGITALVLLPAVFRGGGDRVGRWLLVGFLLQVLFEFFSKGVEHGHIHIHKHEPQPVYVLQVLIGLSLHAFMEGLPLAGSHVHAAHHSFFWAIILHKLPAAFALGILLRANGVKPAGGLLLLLLFALMSPLGVWVGSHWSGDEEMMRIFTALLIGAFFHISTLILFENEKNGEQHHFSIIKLGVILLGFLLAFLVS